MSLQARLQDQALNGRRRGAIALAALAGVVAAAASGLAQSAASAVPDRAAALVLEWPSGRVAAEVRADVLDTPVLPGSVAKVFALAAAVESGVVAASDGHMCRRVATADGRRYACAHPDLKRPLSPAEALAYSCNDFFVRLAARLPRAALNDVRRRAGLAPVSDAAPWATAVLGLAGPSTPPRVLLDAVARLVGVGPSPLTLRADTRALLLDGMRGAVEYGSANTLRGRRPDALAKTGTSPMPGGRSLGLVVAFAPAAAPTRAALVAAPGGAGIDAAALAGDLLAAPPSQSSAQKTLEPTAAAPSSATTSSAPPPQTTRPAASPPAASGRPVTVPTERAVAEVSEADLRTASRDRSIRIGVTQRDGSVKAETLPLEEYVARVISGEGQPKAGPAAHEALAIVIRTFAAANQRRHRAEGYDLCDTTHCQVLRPSLPVARQAALATAGRLLLDGGRPAFVYYSALCGGIPALASEVWPGAVDYQPDAAHDDACDDEPAWTSELRAADLERALRTAGLRGQRLRDLRVLDRTGSRRAGRLRAEGFTPAEVSAHELRMAVGRTLGWQHLRSTAFTVTRTAAGYRFRGVGYGHGVGLCVIGAGRRAARGESAAQILRAYFGPLTVSDAAPDATPPVAQAAPRPVPPVAPAPALPSDIRLALPAAEERDRAFVLGVVRRARAEVAAKAGVDEPTGLTITVHPTVESFGRATGQPWWIAASTVGRSIDLLPLGVLRQRGILEPTLRHEVAHVVLEPSLASRPVWVREGLAEHFGNPAAEPPESSWAVCPSDAELLRPVSAGAQREAYARAVRCVRRALGAGTRWMAIR